jgi:hypothetical protein
VSRALPSEGCSGRVNGALLRSHVKRGTGTLRLDAGRAAARRLRHAGRTSHGSVTQIKWPPTNPGRFITCANRASAGDSTSGTCIIKSITRSAISCSVCGS